MNIKGLRVFARIMATGTLSSAAKSLNTSESATSRQLAILEAVLGMELFKRENRRLVPTPEGEAFYHEAKKILTYIDQIPAVVNKIKHDGRRRLHLVVMPRLATAIAVPAVKAFMNSQKHAEVSLIVQPRFYWEHLIVRQPFDLGLGAVPTQAAAIESVEVCTVAPKVLLRPDHPLANRSMLSLADIAHEHFVMMSPETLIGQKTARIFDDMNMAPSSSIQVSQSDILCDFVASGAGIAIHDPLIPSAFKDRIRMVALDTTVRMRFGIFYPSGVRRSPDVLRLSQALVRCTRDYLATMRIEGHEYSTRTGLCAL